MTRGADPERAGAPPANMLPSGLSPYRRTDIFTQDTVPAGLLKAHSTKAGIWGLIHVVEGELTYRIVDGRRAAAERILTPATQPGLVEPEILHEVAPRGAVRFFVEFHR